MKNLYHPTNRSLTRLRGYLVSLSLLFVAGTGTSFYVTLQDIDRHHENLAREMGRAFFSVLVTTRRWNAMHGGVYVPVTLSIQPNPYLKEPLRDVTTTDGLHLTKISPAHMTRLIAELAREREGVQFHLTSLRPVNPLNAPDEWERQSLEKLHSGHEEVSGVVAQDGGVRFRYMSRLITEQGCLKCHDKDGYTLGSVRGGISVSIPYAPYLWAVGERRQRMIWLHSAVVVLGLSGIWGFGFSLARNISKLETTNRKMSQLNRWLEVTAITDPLTGIPNRLFFDETLQHEVSRAERHQLPLALVMVDIDHFKAINDRHGHQAGDQVLRELAALFQRHKRSSDHIARWGGEEFVLVAPHTSLARAVALGERLRTLVAQHSFSIPDLVSISLGVTEYRPGETADSLLGRVDQALYRAKENGRDRLESLAV